MALSRTPGRPAACLTVLLGGCLGWGAVPGCWLLAALMLGWVRAGNAGGPGLRAGVRD
ncbi:hypothetical protein [Streptomyces rimosus]|uniref:hypothetical protein n=1 Tax=Streptomyces rimosus TaxID=1927 RepID=UPI0037AEDFA2